MSLKTNALRHLDTLKIDYSILEYDVNDGEIDGKSVAEKLNLSHEEIFKTLVTLSSTNEVYVFVIPVSCELDLKKAALAVSEKSISMLPVKDILKVTGYVKGGCSPIGMKKDYPSVFDESIRLLDKITFNAGKIGLQVQLSTSDLDKIIDYKVLDICK